MQASMMRAQWKAPLWIAGASVLLLGCPKRPEAVNPEPYSDQGPATDGQPRVEVQPSAQAQAALAQAEATARSGTPHQAIEAYLSVRKAYPATAEGEEALYRAGLVAFDQGDFTHARSAFNELLFENPLFDKALDAREKLGLSSLQVGAYRDAYQTLSSIVDKVPDSERPRVAAAVAEAAQKAGLFSDALRNAVDQAGQAQGSDAIAAAVQHVTDLVENDASARDVAQLAQDTQPTNPAWPTLQFKLARIYFHLRDWEHLEPALAALLQQAPQSAYAQDARALQTRIAHLGQVNPKVVGVVLPMSGRYQPFGEAVLRGIKLALDGTDVQLVVKDDAGDPARAATAVEQLAFDDGAIAALGPLLTDDAKRAAVTAEELALPILTMTRSESITDIGPHVFRNMLTNSAQAKALADWASQTLGYKSFGVLYPNIPYGVELANDFWDAVKKDGGTMRAAESYQNDQTTFTAEAKKLVGRYYLEDRSEYIQGARELNHGTLDSFHKHKAFEKLRSNLDPVVDFEALFIPDDWRRVGLIAPALAVEDIITNACDPRDLARIKKTTGKKHLKTVTLLGANQWSSPKGPDGVPELIARAGKFVNCAVYVDGFYAGSAHPATQRFVKAYQDVNKGGPAPGLLEASGYDSARMLREVIDQKRPATREALRDALEQVKGFDGATGVTSFNAQREAEKPLFFLRVINGQLHELDPKAPVSGS